MKLFALMALLFFGVTANAQQAPRHKNPDAQSLQACMDFGNLANRVIFDRFHTNDMEASIRKVSQFQADMAPVSEKAANSYTGVLLRTVMAAYEIPYTPNESEQRVAAEAFIRGRLSSCIQLITQE